MLGIVYDSIMLRHAHSPFCYTDYLTVPQGDTLITQSGKCLSSARTDAAVMLNPLTTSESLPSANFTDLNIRYDIGPFCIAVIASIETGTTQPILHFYQQNSVFAEGSVTITPSRVRVELEGQTIDFNVITAAGNFFQYQVCYDPASQTMSLFQDCNEISTPQPFQLNAGSGFANGEVGILAPTTSGGSGTYFGVCYSFEAV